MGAGAFREFDAHRQHAVRDDRVGRQFLERRQRVWDRDGFQCFGRNGGNPTTLASFNGSNGCMAVGWFDPKWQHAVRDDRRGR